LLTPYLYVKIAPFKTLPWSLFNGMSTSSQGGAAVKAIPKPSALLEEIATAFGLATRIALSTHRTSSQ